MHAERHISIENSKTFYTYIYKSIKDSTLNCVE